MPHDGGSVADVVVVRTGCDRWPMRSVALALTIVTISCASGFAPPVARGRSTEVVVIDGPLEAALGQPRVYAQLRDGKRVLEGEPAMPLLDDTRESFFTAFLDTGASGHVLSVATARRFAVKAHENAVFNEVGLHGAHQVGVSRAYTLSLADHEGALLDERGPGELDVVQKEILLQLSRDEPQGLLAQLGLEMNVVGMPAIERLVVEFDPAPMIARDEELASLGAGPAVRLHRAGFRPREVDHAIALEYMDFNQRKHPNNRGPLPELADNPMITGIETSEAGRTFTGDWLLDTGAAASIVSVEQAKALGLYDANGAPTRPADFTLPLGGVGGDVKPTDGYVVDGLKVKTKDGHETLEFRNVCVAVKDVSVVFEDGQTIVLDGVFGMNLLLPSGSGLSVGLPTRTFDGAFERVWIDGPKRTLLLDRRD